MHACGRTAVSSWRTLAQLCSHSYRLCDVASSSGRASLTAMARPSAPNAFSLRQLPGFSLPAVGHSARRSGTTRSSSRSYPSEPRVGVGVVLFRSLPRPGDDPQVLVIKRGKEPGKGMWSFPGGGLELGETMAACAEREILEETGLRLRNAADPASEEGFSDTLAFPTPFAAVDAIYNDPGGAVQFHYAVVEVAAVALDPSAVPVPSDDVDEARWMRVSELRAMPKLTASCARFAEEAVRRFTAPA